MAKRKNENSARSSPSSDARARAADPSSPRGGTKTEGAVKGGNGRYHFRMAGLKKVAAGTGYSTAHGGVVEGERMLVGYIHKPRGTGSRLHTHNNEQFNYVLQGTLVGSVNGKRVVAPAGTLIYIPANAPHTLVATPEEDVIFLAIKDLSQGIIGRAVDGTMAGPRYLPGHAPRGGRAAQREGAKSKRRTKHKEWRSDAAIR
ncbi:MAG TPA: cupin domain-containing protein [Burkholderiales bacterium]|nr:cupin domain-containing protein [Burkholderiales bacterium]